jgi:hypothetical protein
MTVGFMDRYYRWAMNERAEELASDFARLRAMTDSSAATALLQCLDGLDAEQRRLYASALLEYRSPFGEAQQGRLRAEQGEVLNHVMEVVNHVMNESLGIQMRQWELRFPGPKRPRNLRRCIRAVLDPLLGPPMEDAEGGLVELTYKNLLPSGHVLRTEVDLAGRRHHLAYSHRLVEPSGGHYTHQSFSLFSWLGLSGETSWDLVTVETAPAVAEQLRGLCAHFLAALPAMLE